GAVPQALLQKHVTTRMSSPRTENRTMRLHHTLGDDVLDRYAFIAIVEFVYGEMGAIPGYVGPILHPVSRVDVQPGRMWSGVFFYQWMVRMTADHRIHRAGRQHVLGKLALSTHFGTCGPILNVSHRA